jgi:RNA polymerase sigma-70 factor (ECF subfamily)
MDQEGLWVAEALRGDQRAFAHLVDTYQAPVYNLCYRMLGNAAEAEDAAQETFVRVYKHLGAYDPQQRLSSWILAVASHYCIDRLRRRRIKWLSLDNILSLRPIAADAVQPEDTIIEHESCTELRGLLQSLPVEYRLVIVLRYWQDLSYAEIAQVVGTTESAVKSRLHRARKMLARRVMAQRKLETRPKVQEGRRVTDNAVL